MSGGPGATLESLDWEWGDAYIISYARDQWAALRRDTRRFLTAETLDELATRIEADYAAHPVPRDCDPPGTADYRGTPDEDDDLDEDGVPGRERERERERERVGLLAGMREVFPQWAISYSPFSRAWIARNDGATICQGSAALLCIALLLIDGRHPRSLSVKPLRKIEGGFPGETRRWPRRR